MPVRSIAAILVIALAAACPLCARVALDSLHVQRVRVDTVTGDWLEFAVVLTGERERAGDGRTPLQGPVDYQLELRAAFRDGSGGAGDAPIFVAGGIAFPGVFEGRRTLFFYLQPELVEFYDLDRDPLAWRLSLRGPEGESELLAPAIRDDARRASFVAQAASAHAEPLLPIFATPFYSERYPEKLAELPAVRRPDAR